VAKVSFADFARAVYESLTDKDLIELALKIKELTNLTSLDLSNNKLSNADFGG
jgi:Leucine-rich repeat (LRR) protein